MSKYTLGIDLIAGLNEEQTAREVNDIIKKMQTSKKFDDLVINLKVDEKVLSTIREFNKSFEKLSHVAQQTGRSLENAFSASKTRGISETEKRMQKAISRAQELNRTTASTTKTAVDGNEKEAVSVDKVLERYRHLNREVRIRNEAGQEIGRRYEVGDREGHSTAVVSANTSGKVTSWREMDNIKKEHQDMERELERHNREAQRLEKQRQDIYRRLSDLGGVKGSNQGLLSMFKEQADLTRDGSKSFEEYSEGLNNLKNNIGQYGRSLGQANQTEEMRSTVLREITNLEHKYGETAQRVSSFKQRATQSDIDGLRRMRVELREYGKELTRTQGVEQFQRKHAENVILLQRQLAGKISPDHQRQLKGLQDRVDKLSHSTRNLDDEKRRLSSRFRLLKSDIVKADQGMARFSRQLASAMVRVPIYAATIGAMYAPMRMFQDAIAQSIEIDSQMVVLERVSNGTIRMNDALESSVDIAERLGNVINEVNDGLISFARQGYRGDDLTAMTEYATLMSNVSDLDVEEAASSLTAAMKGFNIEAEESIHIVNALNEVNVNQPPCTVMYM